MFADRERMSHRVVFTTRRGYSWRGGAVDIDFGRAVVRYRSRASTRGG
jgi:hypothetical protein